jgi:quercetin dioxygenase-like cupin family protein
MKNNSANVPQLQTAKWADYDEFGTLIINGDERDIQMQNSDGTGDPLFSFNGFGADVIRFAANKGVMNHTHEGDHILFVIKGKGIVEYNGIEHPLYPGLSYLIPGEIDHAIRANEDLVLIAVGNNHRPLDSVERMTPFIK